MATVPVTRTWVAGEVVTAAHFNDNIRDVLNYLLAKPIMRVRQSSAQTLATGTGTSLTFTNEDVDSSNMHSNVTNTSRATAVYPGWYNLRGAYAAVANVTGIRRTRWILNGSGTISGSEIEQQTAVGGQPFSMAARPMLIFLNVGEYVELSAMQNSGGNLNTDVTAEMQSTMECIWESN